MQADLYSFQTETEKKQSVLCFCTGTVFEDFTDQIDYSLSNEQRQRKLLVGKELGFLKPTQNERNVLLPVW